jgi:hypothetical protein
MLHCDFCCALPWTSLIRVAGVIAMTDTDYGTATCEGRPGTPLKYQEIDANVSPLQTVRPLKYIS